MSGIPGAYPLVRQYLRLRHRFAGMSVRVSGEENIPDEGQVILAPLHTGYDDPYILFAHSPRRLAFLSRYDRKPEVREQLREQERMAGALAVGSIMVDRTVETSNWPQTLIEKVGMKPPTREATLQNTLQVLRAGGALCIFPQGTHRELHDIGTLGTLTARIALLSGAPIVPTVIRLGNENGAKTAAITFGEQLLPAEQLMENTADNRAKLTAKLHDRLAMLADN